MEKLILYTWQDVERCLYLNKDIWPKEWYEVSVYSDEIVIYVNKLNKELRMKYNEFLLKLFRIYYKDENIVISLTNTIMEITFEEIDKKIDDISPFPLFKDFTYITKENNKIPQPLSGVDVMAFHSYKGGVGRTLSLIIFVKNMIEQYGIHKKVLIVDGDIEAPGLTWLGQEQNGMYEFSFIDLLNVINSKGIDDNVYENISEIIKNSKLTFHGSKINSDQYFLPTYRYESQLLNIYSNPERIMNGDTNKYIITDALSKIGEIIGVDMVLVDLRAGISEYSAPLLFDPRVKKVIVTSTSEQSIVGTELLLKQIKKQKDNIITNIILTMVENKAITSKEKSDIYQRLLGDNKELNQDIGSYIEKMDDIIEVINDPLLVHLGNLDEICSSLNSANKVTEVYNEIVKNAFSKTKNNEQFSENDIKVFRNKLHEIAENNVTAEADDKTNLLITKAVMQLGRFTREVPKINILGAKGSGKTYLYKQMMAAETWNEFMNVIGRKCDKDTQTLICPIICSEDRSRFINLIKRCNERCSNEIDKIQISKDLLSKNDAMVKEAIDKKISENEWTNLWEQLIWGIFDDISNWNELDEYLLKINKKIIFIFDGIETLFSGVVSNNVGKSGIKALCKNIINRINEYQLDNIGMIIFLRKDIAELAIDVNFEQFRNQYQAFELNWSQADALKLAWKLADNAAEEIGLQLIDNKEDIPIYNLSSEVIESNLNNLWGKKMGPDGSKTAVTTRWVLASLSDFNGQLQARDIVRFLEYATVDLSVKKDYQDRLLTPDIMKKAIITASEKKLREVKDEIHQLESSFNILESIPTSKKQVPLIDEVLDKLPNEDIKALERFGYLKEADGEYYIAENIRYALGYNKTRRGGIKLVSLLVRK